VRCFSSNFITGEKIVGHVACVCVCDSFSWKSCSRKETTEKNLVHTEVILNKMFGRTADSLNQNKRN